MRIWHVHLKDGGTRFVSDKTLIPSDAKCVNEIECETPELHLIFAAQRAAYKNRDGWTGNDERFLRDLREKLDAYTCCED